MAKGIKGSFEKIEAMHLRAGFHPIAAAIAAALLANKKGGSK